MILGIMLLTILTVIGLARAGPAVLYAIGTNVSLAAFILVAAIGWGLVAGGSTRSCGPRSR